MRAVFATWLVGNVTCFALTALLWVVVPRLLTPIIGTNWIGLYPALVILPPLVVGGYVAARLTKSRFRSRYVVLGAAVGLTASATMLAILTVSMKGNPVWLLVPIFAGAALSGLGALLGGRVSRADASI